MDDYLSDIVIIGGGLGGLLCGAILSKEGYNVTILEQDKQIGGCLQTFAFHKKVFDSCVHYIGGLGKGHSLNSLFRYVGIIDKLRLQELDREGFDEIIFENEKAVYPIANRELFIERLLPFFPAEKSSLEKYLSLIDEVAGAFPLYNLRHGSAVEKEQYMHLELVQVLNDITSNERLRKVLAGNNFLYAGVEGVTPFYVHALVTHSYLHSAHKVLPGSSEIAKALGIQIRANGGKIARNSAALRLEEKDGKIVSVKTQNGEFRATHFISAIHPSRLLEIIDSKLIRPAYRQRINTLKQSPPAIMLNLVLRPNSIAARSKNVYWHPDGRIFLRDGELAPKTLGLFFTKDAGNSAYSDTLSVLGYDDYKQYEQWALSINRAGLDTKRPEEYEQYKEAVATRMMKKLFRLMPELEGNITGYSIASPLTFRDYTGTPEGSLYGIRKDVGLPAAGGIGTRTKVPNLFLTGQNINLHGVLGVGMSALTTCAEFLDMKLLLDKINAL